MARREVAEKFAQVPPQRFSVQRDSEDEGIFSDKWWANLFHSCTEVPLLKALEFFVGNPPQKQATGHIKKLALA